MIKISVIIPVYNVSAYIKDCIECCKRQTLQDVEYILIDDGSTDNSLELIYEYTKNDSRFVVKTQENQGQGIARNNAIKIAKGEYIAFLDPDDWIEDYALEHLYSYAVNNNAQVVRFLYKKFDEQTQTFKNVDFVEKIQRRYNYNLIEQPYYNWRRLKEGCMIHLDLHVWTLFYKRDFIISNDIQFAPNKRGEDHLFTLGVLFLSDKIHFLNEYLYNYRVRLGSSMMMKSDENLCVFKNIDLMEKFLKEHSLFDELQDEFEFYKYNFIKWHYKINSSKSLKQYEKLAKKYISSREQYEEMIKNLGMHRTFLEGIFSIRNSYEFGKKYKIVTILFISFKYPIKKRSSV